MIWLIFAFLTCVSIAFVTAPILRRNAVAMETDSDVDVYAGQLAEVEREWERGLLSPADYSAARAEIGRRLIATKAASEQTKTGQVTTAARIASVVVLVLTPVVSFAVYAGLGNPGLGDQPLSMRADLRMPDSSADILDMVAQVEAHLETNRDDSQGWALIAPVYMQLGRPGDAADAWRNVLRIDGSSFTAEANLGEALVAAARGDVTEDATRAFQRALEFDKDAVQPRFYLALGLSQAGETRGAAQAWADLLSVGAASAAPGEAWVVATVQQLRDLNAKLGEDAVELPDVPGLAVFGQVANPDEDPNAAIAQMVSSLATRLANEGGTVEEWSRLVRSYSVLGDMEAAKAALADGVEALPADAADVLLSSSKQIGVTLD